MNINVQSSQPTLTYRVGGNSWDIFGNSCSKAMTPRRQLSTFNFQIHSRGFFVSRRLRGIRRIAHLLCLCLPPDGYIQAIAMYALRRSALSAWDLLARQLSTFNFILAGFFVSHESHESHEMGCIARSACSLSALPSVLSRRHTQAIARVLLWDSWDLWENK